MKTTLRRIGPLVCLIALILLLVAGCSSSSDDENGVQLQPNIPQKPATSVGKEPVKDEIGSSLSNPAPLSVATPPSFVMTGSSIDVEYQISNVGKEPSVAGPLGTEQASGVFVSMTVNVKNDSTKEQHIDDIGIGLKLYDGQGREYEQSARRSSIENPYSYESIAPGGSLARTALFDVSPDATGLVLRVHGWGYSNEETTYVKLNIQAIDGKQSQIAKLHPNWTLNCIQGGVAEVDQYHKCDDWLADTDVIHHARPEWLGNQHLDIYISAWNIAIEYQGLQHDQPVEFFGGDEAFKERQNLDARKKELCELNGIRLMYVREGYNFENLKNQISSNSCTNCGHMNNPESEILHFLWAKSAGELIKNEA